jgi:hypothetical protein
VLRHCRLCRDHRRKYDEAAAVTPTIRSRSTWLNQPAVWFQLAKMRVTLDPLFAPIAQLAKHL